MGKTIYYGNTGLAKFGRSGNEGKTLAFYLNDSGTWEGIPFGHVRNSNATETNNGILTEVGVDVPRFQDGKYFTEDEATNTVLNSRPNATENYDDSISYEVMDIPFFGGNTNVVRYGDNSVSRSRYCGNRILNTDFTFSAYVIMDDGSEPIIGGGDTAGTDFYLWTSAAIPLSNIGKENIPNTNIWRVWGYNQSGTNAGFNGIRTGTNANGKGFVCTQFDLVEGTNPSSPILTTGSTATRQADTGIQSLVDLSNQINSEEGVFRMKVTQSSLEDSQFISVTDSVNYQNGCIDTQFLSNGSFRLQYRTTGNVAQFDYTSSVLDLETLNDIVFVYKDSLFSVYINEVLAVEQLSGSVNPANTFKDIRLSRIDTGSSFNGTTDLLTLYPSIAEAQVNLPYIS